MGFMKTFWGLATSKEKRKCMRNLNQATINVIVKQNYDLAFDQLNFVLDSNAASVHNRCTAFTLLGQAYVWKQEYEKAKDYLEKAVDLSMKTKERPSDLYDFLGYAYFKTGDYAKALQFYRLAIQHANKTLLNRVYMKHIGIAEKNIQFLEKHEDILPFLTAYYQQNKNKFEAPKDSK